MKIDLTPGRTQAAAQPDPNAADRPTPEDRKSRAKSVVSSLFNQPASAATPAEQPPATPAATPAAAAAPAAAPARPPAPAITLSDDLTNVVRLARGGSPAEPEPLAAPDFDLIAEDREDLAVHQYLARKDPKKHGKAPEQFLAFLKKNYAFQDDWMSKNPGQDFNAESPEYVEWLGQNPPPLDRDTIDKARTDMIIDQRVDERLAAITPELQKNKDEKIMRDQTPIISQNVNRQVYAMIDAVDPEFSKLCKDAAGNIDLGEASAARVDEADPIAHAVMMRISQTELSPLIIELEKLATPGLNYKLDPDKSAVHRTIKRYWDQAERDLAAAPEEQQLRDGRRYLTIKQKAAATQSIMRGAGTSEEKEAKLNELEQGTWVLTIDDLEEIITDDLAERAKREIAALDAPARKKYARQATTAENGQPPARRENPQPRPESTPAPAPQPQGNRPPPSMSSGSDAVPVGRPDAGGEQSLGKQVRSVMFK